MEQIGFPYYPKPRKSAFFWIMLSVAIVILLTSVAIVAFIIFSFNILSTPSSKAKGLKGNFLNAVAVAGPKGETRLWILTDGSFYYILTEKSPGRFSRARKCKSCKTFLYVYDPVSKTVLTEFRTDYKDIIINTQMTRAGDKIWVVSSPYGQNEPEIFVYKIDPPSLICETSYFISKYPELSSGIIDIRMERNPARLNLDTKDGRTGLVLTLEDEKLYADQREFRKAIEKSDEKQATMFVLAPEGTNYARRKLYKVTGSEKGLKEEFEDRGNQSYSINPDSLRRYDNIIAEPMTPARIYLEGMIFYQDEDSCLILHQDAVGKIANRMLTCIDSTGKERWTVGQDALFKEMKLDTDKDALSTIFLIKEKIEISRVGNLVMLQLSKAGVIGFDFATGKKLWEIRL